MKQTKIEQLCESARKIDHVYEVWATAHGLTSCEMQIYYVIMKKEKAVITQKELCMELDAPKTSINSPDMKKKRQRCWMKKKLKR